MTTFLIILFSAIIFLFALHFGVLHLTKQCYPRPHILLKDNRWEITTTRNPSFMISYNRFSKSTADDYYETDFARMLHFNIGGLSFIYHYGHKFAEVDSTYYFGFSSNDGELFWKTICIGTEFYNNPFAFNRSCGHFIYDAAQNRLVKYTHSNYPIYLALENHPYVNSRGETQNVEQIDFYIEEDHYTAPIFKFLHLEKFIHKTVTRMMFDVKKGDGLGVEKDIMQGEAFRISSSVTLNDLYKSMRRLPHKTPCFHSILKNRIFAWMHSVRKY